MDDVFPGQGANTCRRLSCWAWRQPIYLCYSCFYPMWAYMYSLFSSLLQQSIWPKKLKRDRVYFSLQFEDLVYHNVTSAKAQGSWPYWIHSQKTQWWLLAGLELAFYNLVWSRMQADGMLLSSGLWAFPSEFI